MSCVGAIVGQEPARSMEGVARMEDAFDAQWSLRIRRRSGSTSVPGEHEIEVAASVKASTICGVLLILPCIKRVYGFGV